MPGSLCNLLAADASACNQLDTVDGRCKNFHTILLLHVKQAAMPLCRYKGSDERSRKMYINWRLHQIRQPTEEGPPFADLASGDQLADVVSDLDQRVMSEINRDRLREHMWQETMVRAGKPFADLINIPTQLVKELMDLKY